MISIDNTHSQSSIRYDDSNIRHRNKYFATTITATIGRGVRGGGGGQRRQLIRLGLVLLLYLQVVASSWGGNDDEDKSIFGNSLTRDWMSDSSSISIQLEGCAWGYVADNEEAGCLENGSQDGTTYWYQMANCRRAQAVFSVFGSSSGSASCNKNNFKESFVTKYGLSEFLGYLSQYDSNNAFGDGSGDDGQYDDDAAAANDGNDNGDYGDLPLCENGIGLGCADDGTFALQYFSDSYCLKPTGKTYDRLKSLNRALRTYKSCASIYTSGNDNTLLSYLVSTSESCSSIDNGLCSDNSAMKDRRSHTSSNTALSRNFGGGKTWITKLKYATGGMLLLASFVMFTGILFTNRRRRRALLQRKYRQSRSRKSSSRSKSKSRGDSSRKPSRSRSKAKPAGSDGEGVFA